MKRALAALLLVGGVTSAFGQAPTPSEREKIRYIIVYGTDPCPRTTRDEIIVCSRRPESDRQRIPPEVLEDPLSPQSESWTRKAERLETMGKTGINSCSPVGPAGGTGCLLEMIKRAREEQQEVAAEQARTP